MRRLPHTATLLRPSTSTDAYGDEVDGPLAPVGEPFPAWLQIPTPTENINGDGEPVTAFPRLYFRDVLFLIEEDDVVEVNGKRYTVIGEPSTPTNPRGRSRFTAVALKRVTRGGN